MTDDLPRLSEAGRGWNVTYRGRSLYAHSDPEGSAQKRVRPLSIQPGTLILIPSPLLFHGISELLRILPADCHVLAVEADQALMALTIEHAPDALLADPRITLIRTDRPEGAAAVLETLGTWRFRRCTLVPLNGGFSLYPDRYRSIHTALEECISTYWQNRMTLIFMGRLLVRNLFENLPLVPDSRMLSELRVDRPIVVAGAGESLEHGIRRFRDVRDRICLVAADTALPVLLEAGIEPDLIVMLEAQAANLQDFIGSEGIRSALVCDIASYPGIVRRFPGRRYFFSSRFGSIRLLDRLADAALLPDPIPPLGSVGVAALQIALSAGDASGLPIFLTGLDFAYTPGKPHAKGAPSHRRHLARSGRLAPDLLSPAGWNRPLLSVPGKDGEAVTTDLVLRGYALQAQRIAESSDRVYDLGGTGLPLGAKPLSNDVPLRDLLDETGSGSKRTATEGTAAEPRPTGMQPDALRSAAGVRAFFRGELELLEAIIDRGKAFLREENGGGGEAALLELLREGDYLSLPFPDPPPLPKTDRSFLARAVNEALAYRERLSRIDNAINLRRS